MGVLFPAMAVAPESTSTWNNDFCCCGEKPCYKMKDCGCYPMCCPNMCCCMWCMWASAMSQTKEKPDWTYMKCCAASICIPCCCTEYHVYKELSTLYGISDGKIMLKPCAPIFSYIQLIDTVMVKEKLTMVPMGVAPDAAPGAAN